jgi:hypothetical protein
MKQTSHRVGLTSAIALIASVALTAAALAWQIETIETGRLTGVDCSVTVDDSCRPHISYAKIGTGTLRYAVRVASNWATETVDSGDVGAWTSIALDKSGCTHISYLDYVSYHLKYAYWTGTDWQTQTIDSSPGVGEYTSIAIDDSGRPHIAYYAATGRNLKYAFLGNEDWSVETVDSVGYVGRNCSMALRFGITPYISYENVDLADVKSVHREGGTWVFADVDTDATVGADPSVAIGSDGYPRVAYKAAGTGGLRLAKWTGSNWAMQSVDAGAAVGRLCLALDSYGYDHVIYQDLLLNALKHAYWDGSSWQIETVDAGYVELGCFNSMAIDGLNNIHVAYCAYLDTFYSDSELRYATRGPTAVVEAYAGPRYDYRLYQNSPNPFTGSTRIRFQLAVPGDASIKVYDIAGRQVKVLVNGKLNAGWHDARWNGTDAVGRQLPSGVYFCRMTAGKFLSTEKLILVR